jgi:DNA-binding Lrp family transcriptional regulator
MKDSAETLNGTRLAVYRFILTYNKRVGIREIARELNLASPSVAQHHLTRLEELGLIKREWGGYVINKVVLQNHIKINRFLIPRPVFYLLFVICAVLVEFIVYPAMPLPVYLVVLFIKITAITICVYELIMIGRHGQL